MDRPNQTAVYDPNRRPNGQFVPGNKLRQGTSNDVQKRYSELRTLWFSATSVTDMARVRDGLVEMCTTCPNPDVRLRAIIYFCDRMLGKPTERVEMDVSSQSKPMPLPDLSPEEVAVLSKVISRSQDDVIEADVTSAR